MTARVVVLGIFVADTTYRAERMPRLGETILGNSFVLGPGGKGSNQAVAAARAGGDVRMLTKLGQDDFAEMALGVWTGAGVTPVISQSAESYTGAAFIYVEESSGNNAIIVAPGAAATISAGDVDGWGNEIAQASVLLTQLEQPLDAAYRALELAREAGAVTILNPAPAASLPDDMLALCDYLTPNESEAEGLTGIAVHSVEDARKAAEALLEKGVGRVVVTLGENGVLLHGRDRSLHIPAITAGPVVETTGAGDAFNGGFATALAGGAGAEEAARFGVATAGVSVTRPGAARSMPDRAEIEALLAGR
ncbi:ribokinase [Meridianimarinicoccus sp. MJW13]|uniref:ribokinase n=1 Tax=Meridianimarinicoccus sp. MJW13 TaxID=2720031 RepID=UPI00186942AE|nr:ribokinase [Fluviibacterium sp. MJW13]